MYTGANRELTQLRQIVCVKQDFFFFKYILTTVEKAINKISQYGIYIHLLAANYSQWIMYRIYKKYLQFLTKPTIPSFGNSKSKITISDFSIITTKWFTSVFYFFAAFIEASGRAFNPLISTFFPPSKNMLRCILG